MQQLEDEDELAYTEENAMKETGGSLTPAASLNSIPPRPSDGRPAWMRTLFNSATTWLELLPTNLPVSISVLVVMFQTQVLIGHLLPSS